MKVNLLTPDEVANIPQRLAKNLRAFLGQQDQVTACADSQHQASDTYVHY